MTRAWLLIVGILAAVSFALTLLVAIPQAMLIQLNAPEGLRPYTPSELVGRRVYIQNGCVYCHSQQVRDPAFTTDVERGWGPRPTFPEDYVYDRPHLLGTMRTGPDLINVGDRLPDRNWHLIHLYNPRSVVRWSIMPTFPFLFQEKAPSQVAPEDVVVPVAGPYAPQGKVVVAKYEALALVDYLLSLDRTYPPSDDAETGQPSNPESPSHHGP
jgi:cytochrome c oxidase cbb3-type subunit 2